MNPNLPEWPEELPQNPFGDTPPDYRPQDSTIRSQNDTGPAKLRRRFTATVEDVTVGPLQITAAQRQRLEDFCRIDVAEVKQFAWKNFRDDSPAPYRFKAGWSSVQETFIGTDALGVEWYSVTIAMEMLPA